VTWAHGIQDSVVKHPYYGSSIIKDDLQILEGWDKGLVTLSERTLYLLKTKSIKIHEYETKGSSKET
jgi:hypothetical protein